MLSDPILYLLEQLSDDEPFPFPFSVGLYIVFVFPRFCSISGLYCAADGPQ